MRQASRFAELLHHMIIKGPLIPIQYSFPRLATIMPIYCTVAGAGAGGALRRLATVRSRELCEALESRAGLLPAA